MVNADRGGRKVSVYTDNVNIPFVKIVVVVIAFPEISFAYASGKCQPFAIEGDLSLYVAAYFSLFADFAFGSPDLFKGVARVQFYPIQGTLAIVPLAVSGKPVRKRILSSGGENGA